MVRTRRLLAAPLAGAVFACGLAAATPLRAQSRTPPAAPQTVIETDAAWSLQGYVTSYAVPEDDNYIQPTVIADRGRLHLEGRVNYEDLRSVSGFVGWNLDFGDRLAVSLTPMLGAVAGNTDGVIPALELAVEWGRIDAYSEGEYVFATNDRHSRYLYSWSEVSAWPTDWLRGGLVFQQTRAYQTSRDIQRGLLLGIALPRVNGTIYWFNPGHSHQFVVFTVGVAL